MLDVIEDEGLLERATALGDAIRSRMLAWQERFDAIGDVRGLGAMLALELVHDRESKDPAPELATAVSARFEIPQRDVLHLLRSEFRKVRAAAAKTFRDIAANQPATVESELPYVD